MDVQKMDSDTQKKEKKKKILEWIALAKMIFLEI